jgi:hypothetical protein
MDKFTNRDNEASTTIIFKEKMLGIKSYNTYLLFISEKFNSCRIILETYGIGLFYHVNKFHKFQEHNNLIHAPTFELHAQVPIWPFSIWGLDLMGKISPFSLVAHTFIINTKTYFTKWVEAIPLHSTIADAICHFIFKHIIAHFGFPFALVLDNGTLFKNNDLKKILENFHIQHNFSTSYYPQ